MATTTRSTERPEMGARTTRAWFVAGLVHLLLGAVLGAVTAAPAPVDPRAHAVLLATGVALLAAAAVHGLLPAFLQRDWELAPLAHASLALLALGDVLGLVALAMRQGDAVRVLAALHGAALGLVVVHVPLARLVGRRWKAGVRLMEPGQPFRRADVLTAFAFAAGGIGLVAAVLLLVTLPRNVPTAGLLALVTGFAAPASLGALLFLLPRETRRPLTGSTLVGAALLFHVLGAAMLAFGFVRAVGVDFRGPAFVVALGHILAAVALARTQLPGETSTGLGAVRPLLRTCVVLALLAAVAIVLAFVAGLPNELLPLAFYAEVTLVAALAACALAVGAPLMLPGRARLGGWAKWAPALAIVGLFLLAPSFQYPRSPFPGAVVLTVAVLVALRGLWPLAAAKAFARPNRRGRRGRRA